jgi:hypothetical protein
MGARRAAARQPFELPENLIRPHFGRPGAEAIDLLLGNVRNHMVCAREKLGWKRWERLGFPRGGGATSSAFLGLAVSRDLRRCRPAKTASATR